MKRSADPLSRRERQIMDIVFARGQATVTDVVAALPDPPSYNAVRALMRILEEKGHLRHQEAGKHYIYLPTQPPQAAAEGALQRVVQTFFGGSVERTVAALLSPQELGGLTPDELQRLRHLIDTASEEKIG